MPFSATFSIYRSRKFDTTKMQYMPRISSPPGVCQLFGTTGKRESQISRFGPRPDLRKAQPPEQSYRTVIVHLRLGKDSGPPRLPECPIDQRPNHFDAIALALKLRQHRIADFDGTILRRS